MTAVVAEEQYLPAAEKLFSQTSQECKQAKHPLSKCNEYNKDRVTAKDST
jgi:hypothetical protein